MFCHYNNKTVGFVTLALLCCAFSNAPYAVELTGTVDKFTDGDTFIIWQQRIRLAGIDASEYAQSCKDDKGKKYQCGAALLNYLKEIVRDNEVRCTGSQRDAYDRLLATCYVGDVNMNQRMVAEGWSVAFIKFSDEYATDETDAKAARKGMWRGTFTRPADYRETKWTDARAKAATDSGECVIKGNINSKGVKIYHTPWSSRHYNRTKINTNKGEKWFCDEGEALAAGWRAPYR